ncbi:MAG: NfeD family protein [Spirochaetaceae bacterium]
MLTDPAFVWGVVGIVLLVSELLVPGFVIFFFGLGALITAVASLILPPVAGSLALQGIVWALGSILSLRFLRRRFARVFRGGTVEPVGEADLGRTVVVTERITPGRPGRVRFQGTSWKAVSYTETFKPGDKAQIVQEDNLTLIVSEPFLEE